MGKTDKELKDTIRRFVENFEQVFDKDWEYTKEMMGIQDETEEQKKNANGIGFETIEIISNNGTFLNPKVDDETEDWGCRGALLQEYRRLKSIIEK